MKKNLTQRFKRAYVMGYVTLATILTGGTAAFATTTVIVPHAPGNFNDGITGVTAGNATSSGGGIWASIGQLTSDLVGLVGGLAVAYTLYELYHAAMLFMSGGANAQKREMAKTHLVHVAIGGALVGGSGIVLGVLMGILGGLKG